MSKKDTHQALLPNGFVDLLPPEAEQEAKTIAVLMKKFAAFGYARIKPPLVEFEESLLGPGPGAALAQETFRVMDPVSHRMMGVRSDMTPQTARIATSRLSGEERPLRLAYANDVLRTKGCQQRTERQFCQVGCELIGAADTDAEIEVAVIALLGLKEIGVEAVTIDLAVPTLVSKLFEAFNVSEDEQVKIEAALKGRKRDAVAKLDGKIAKVLSGLLEVPGEAEQALAKLKALGLPKEAKKDADKLKVIYEGLKKSLGELGLDDVAITIDPLEHKGFEYHSSIGFTLFAKSVRGELGRGGRYDVRFGDQDKNETASGFTLYMDTIRKALPAPQKKDSVYVSASESWGVIKSLQDEGWIVVRGVGKDKRPEGCTHIYKNGTVTKI